MLSPHGSSRSQQSPSSPFPSAGQDMAPGTCSMFLPVCSGGPGLTLSRRATVEDGTQVQATEASQCLWQSESGAVPPAITLRAVNVLDWSSENQAAGCVTVSPGGGHVPRDPGLPGGGRAMGF